jgi:hypothetical protein
MGALRRWRSLHSSSPPRITSLHVSQPPLTGDATPFGHRRLFPGTSAQHPRINLFVHGVRLPDRLRKVRTNVGLCIPIGAVVVEDSRLRSTSAIMAPAVVRALREMVERISGMYAENNDIEVFGTS